ncbi:EamA family transporter [Candidatus Saccharibacteria bacterium]|nr:EamA family transporter [Candidatus Saccharibacteria bacterium]
MIWVILVIFATVLDSLRIFVDNYVSDVYFKKRLAYSQRLFYGYLGLVAAIIILAVSGSDIHSASPGIIAFLILSGLLSAASAVPYIRTLEIDDSTNLGIFIQLAPILYLILGWLFLGDTFSPMQLVAFVVILAAPLLIVLTTRKRSRHTKIKAVVYALIYVFIAVVGNLIFVIANEKSPSFVSSIGLLTLGKSLGYIAIVWSRPKWHRRFYRVLKTSKYKVLLPMFINYAISLVKDFVYRGALVFAPTVAVASAASDSTEPIVIFFMGILLTLIWPKFGREKLDKKSILTHLVATVLVVIGIVLLQM